MDDSGGGAGLSTAGAAPVRVVGARRCTPSATSKRTASGSPAELAAAPRAATLTRVIPGSTRTLYIARHAGFALLGLVAIGLAIAAYWATDRWILAPPAPTDSSAAPVWIDYLVDERGLVRDDASRAAQRLNGLVRRLLADEPFRHDFAACLRRGSAEEQAAFREHVFDAFKPAILADVRRYHELGDDARTAFLDERLVAFKRLELLSRGSKIDRASWADAAGTQAELLKLLAAKTTDEERSLGAAYIRAAAERWNEIRHDPEQLAAFERRLVDAP